VKRLFLQITLHILSEFFKTRFSKNQMDCIDLFYYAYQLFRMNTVFMDKTIRTLNCKHTLLFAI